MGKIEKKERLLKRLIFLREEVLTNEPDIANKRYREYVKLRSIYYQREYLPMHPPLDDEFDRWIAEEAMEERKGKYKEKFKRIIEEKKRPQKRLISLWRAVPEDRTDKTSKEYRKYVKLRGIYYKKYLYGLPSSEGLDDFDLRVMSEEVEQKWDKEKIEELPSLPEPVGGWPKEGRRDGDMDARRIGDIEL